MPNKNYRAGRRKEYGIIEGLRKSDENWDICQRTSGSHSPFDIIAIDIKGKRIKLIQVKKGLLSDNEETKIYEENKELNNKFDVEFELIN